MSFNLNTDADGDDVVTMEGVARIDGGAPPASVRRGVSSRSTRACSRATAGRGAYFAGGVPGRRPGHPDALAGGLKRCASPTGALALAAVGAAGAVGARVGGRAMVARTERRLCRTTQAPPYGASERARDLHARLSVVDLHADSLLWGRDLLRRDRSRPGRRAPADRGQRRAPGPRGEHEVAAPPQHRAQRRPER